MRGRKQTPVFPTFRTEEQAKVAAVRHAEVVVRGKTVGRGVFRHRVTSEVTRSKHYPVLVGRTDCTKCQDVIFSHFPNEANPPVGQVTCHSCGVTLKAQPMGAPGLMP